MIQSYNARTVTMGICGCVEDSVPHMSEYFYPIGGTLWEGLGGVPLLEEMKFQEPKSFPVLSLCFLRVDKDVSSQPAPVPWGL